MENNEKTEPVENKNNNQMIILGLIIGAVAIVGFAAFALKGNSQANSQTPTSAVEGATNQLNDTMNDQGTDADNPTTSSAAGTPILDPTAKQINIEAGSFYYKPNVFTVKKGEKVQIVMHSVSMMHNFNIDELNVHGPMIKDGETNTIEFTAEKTGTFEYYCSVGQHRKLGQVGKITVTE